MPGKPRPRRPLPLATLFAASIVLLSAPAGAEPAPPSEAGPEEHESPGSLHQRCRQGASEACQALGQRLRSAPSPEVAETLRRWLMGACAAGQEAACEAIEEETMAQGDDLETIRQSAAHHLQPDPPSVPITSPPRPELEPPRPAPSPNDTTLRGLPRGLTAESLRVTLGRARYDVRRCFASSRRQGANGDGEVVVTFVIAPSGAVLASAPARSTTGDRALDLCVAQAVTRVTFPRPDDGLPVVVSHVFVLSAGRLWR